MCPPVDEVDRTFAGLRTTVRRPALSCARDVAGVVPPRLTDLRRDALADHASEPIVSQLASIYPGLDVLSLVELRHQLLCQTRR